MRDVASSQDVKNARGMTDQSQSLLCLSPGRRASLGLVCIPHAGSGANAFSGWASIISDTVSLWGARFPGKGGRISERPLTTIPEMAESLVEPVLSIRAPHVALLGHCAGALIAYELAHLLSKVKHSFQLRLVVSACEAPSKVTRKALQPFLTMSLPDLVNCLKDLGHTPQTILEDEEVMDVLAPAFRADLDAVQSYVDRADRERLAIPIVVLAEEPRGSYLNWRDRTNDGFRFEKLDTDALVHRATKDRTLVKRLETICLDTQPHEQAIGSSSAERDGHDRAV